MTPRMSVTVISFCGLLHKNILAESLRSVSALHMDTRNGVFRLKKIEGSTGKINDVLVSSPFLQNPEKNVIFFGGDCQDYGEKMQEHTEHRMYYDWSLDNTTRSLARRFLNSNIFTVKPHKMHLNTFSNYGNFMKTNEFGVPEHSSDFGCVEHMRKLIESATAQAVVVAETHENDGTCSKTGLRNDNKCVSRGTSSPHINYVLVAFSKGCTVLNQLLHELDNPDNDSGPNKDFLRSINELYWLDGGHGGGSDTWVTDEETLKQLLKYDFRIYVHVSPYMVEDEARPWIKEEERTFVDKLKEFGVNVSEIRQFEEEPRSILNHFKVLDSF